MRLSTHHLVASRTPGREAEGGRVAPRREGVALVATLIMLSLVTFMAVAFLGVARRERRQVESTISQGEARYGADAALAQAQAELIARIFSTDDKWNYDFSVSTNYQNTNAIFGAGTANPTNVNDSTAGANWLLHLANLQFSPRVPVFNSLYFTNHLETNFGRFYLDFNRNRFFEGTDDRVKGDPHWIGILEYPDAPHSRTNKFISRFAYVVLPAGKSLDLNFVHNQAKRPAILTQDGFLRNLGLSPSEINLAALLREVNLNAFTPSASAGWTYSLYNIGAGPSSGAAFTDAVNLLRWRNNANHNNFAILSTLFGATPASNLTNGTFDLFGDGPLMVGPALNFNAEPTNIPWQGGSNANANAQRFFDVDELFLTNRSYTTFANRLRDYSTNSLLVGTPAALAAADYDRGTYYRLISQLGVDSAVPAGRMNLNWANSLSGSPGGETFGYLPWAADNFFFTAAELMIRASLTPSIYTNAAGSPVLLTNYYFGTNWVSTNLSQTLSITNIPVFPFSLYTAEMHRLLQFAANLYDATTTNNAAPAFPTLFRPTFAHFWPTNDIIIINGYTTNQTDTNLLSLPIVDLTDPNSRQLMYSGVIPANACLIAGLPVVVGAKKGYPNFNEFGMQTVASVTRRLEFVKTNATNIGPMALSGGVPLSQTNQMLIVSLTNVFGLEAWNSYAAAFPRALRLVATNISYSVITNEFGPIWTNRSVSGVQVNMGAGGWAGTSPVLNNSFRSFFFTNYPQLSATPSPRNGYIYATNYPPLVGLTTGGFMPDTIGSAGFGRSNWFPEMRLGMTTTNSLMFALVEVANNRVVDFVNLTNLVTTMDLSAALRSTNNDNRNGWRFWLTNRVGAGTIVNPTWGITNQIAQCTNSSVTYLQTNLVEWTSLLGPAALQGVRLQIESFRRFMGLPQDPAFALNLVPRPGLSVQSPFSPTRIVAQTASWEVNDPLVHYTTRDLSDPFRSSQSAQVEVVQRLIGSPPPIGSIFQTGVRLVNGRLIATTVGGMNRYYLPWGRTFDTTGSALGSFTNSAGQNFYSVATAPYDQSVKDAGVVSSDGWDFPQRKFASLGWLGRVHRGTPWQTAYLKATMANPTNWFYWARATDTHPTNDWRLMDVFSTAVIGDSLRSQLSANQTNLAAWAGVLGGIQVLTNPAAGPFNLTIEPSSGATWQLPYMIGSLTNGLINAKLRVPMWEPVANYNVGEVVGHWFANGTAYFQAQASSNSFQNPLTQTAAGNYSYWTNIFYWNNTTTYAANVVVAHYGLSYRSRFNSNTGWAPHAVPQAWELTTSRSFAHVGQILSVPEFTVGSPYLNVGLPWQTGTAYGVNSRVYYQGWYYTTPTGAPANNPPAVFPDPATGRYAGYWTPVVDVMTDAFVERIPQMALSLLTVEPSPRVVIYAFGQALRPAERSIFVGSGPFQGMVTNYQVIGETVTRTVMRFDNLPPHGLMPRPLPAGAPPQIFPQAVVENFKVLQSDN